MAGLRLEPLAVHLPLIEIRPGQSKTVGRADHADIRVNDPSLSRLHARIDYVADDPVVADLGSTNGITVNGTAQMTAPLYAGDIIKFEIGRAHV